MPAVTRRPSRPRARLGAWLSPALLPLLLAGATARAGEYPEVIAASTRPYPVANGGRWDGANVVLASDGSVWATSANENKIGKLSADGTKFTRWTMPKDAAPSFLLPEADGTFWVAELGGFQVGKFDPATNELKQWADASRRPTGFVKRPDGKLWIPETSGALALFDPATGVFTYYTASEIASLSYPFLEPDGSLWAADFLYGSLVRFAPDGKTAKRWALPNPLSNPSKIFRGVDGALWVSLYVGGELGRFVPATAELKTFLVGVSPLPFDLANYNQRIVFSDQRLGYIGFFDPANATPYATKTLEVVDVTLTEKVYPAVTPTTTVLEVATDDVLTSPATLVTGTVTDNLVEMSTNQSIAYGVAVDEARGKIWFGTIGGLTALQPSVPVTVNDITFPSAASIGGAGDVRWATQLVTWNRGTPDSTGATAAIRFTASLLPNEWIAGYAPGANFSVGAGQLFYRNDPIGSEMGGPDSFGGLRVVPSTQPTDLFAWSRTYLTRPDGGTLGFAWNGQRADAAVGPDETAFFLTPPDTGSRVNAGFLVLEEAKGSLVIVDAEGLERASVPFAWPGGYHYQWHRLFESLGLPRLASARVAFRVETGKVFPFGTAIDDASSDPIGLTVLRPKVAATLQSLPGVARGAGTMGSGSRTDVQLFNPGVDPATVRLEFRAAAAVDGPAPAPGLPSATVTVPPGKVVALEDFLLESLGLDGVFGEIDVVSDVPLFAFARVTAPDPESEGRVGFGVNGVLGELAVNPGSRAVFINVTDSGSDGIEPELEITNPAWDPTTVTIKLTAADGQPAGSRSLALGPRETRTFRGFWGNVSGSLTEFGRVEVLPDEGKPGIFAFLLRRDVQTGDADLITPYVLPK